MKRYPPIDPSTNDLFQTAKDGVLLCKLIDLVVPGTIDERTINTKKISTYGRGMKIVICLDSAKTIGCTVVNIETRDLVEGRPHLLLGLKEIHLNNDLLHRFYGMELSPVLKAIESHHDQVSCVPPNGIVLGYSAQTDIEIFAVGNTVLGIQCHPEFSEDVLLDILKARLAQKIINEEVANEAMLIWCMLWV
jgi:hypothetical protein